MIISLCASIALALGPRFRARRVLHVPLDPTLTNHALVECERADEKPVIMSLTSVVNVIKTYVTNPGLSMARGAQRLSFSLHDGSLGLYAPEALGSNVGDQKSSFGPKRFSVVSHCPE